MANPRSFLDKVTPVAAMRTGCAEGGVVSGAWRQFVGELLKSKIGWNFFLRFRVRWPKSHAYLGFRQPNISNFYGFSWWFFQVDAISGILAEGQGSSTSLGGPASPFFPGQASPFFSIVYEFRKTIHHWILRGTLFQTKPDRMRLLGRRLWFLIRFLWSMPLSLLQILLVVGCRVYKCDWSVYLISSISSYPVLSHLILLLFFPILDI